MRKSLLPKRVLNEEFALYDRVERIAGEEIMTHRKMLKPVCANVDFYSGFVYTMLNISGRAFSRRSSRLHVSQDGVHIVWKNC